MNDTHLPLIHLYTKEGSLIEAYILMLDFDFAKRKLIFCLYFQYC